MENVQFISTGKNYEEQLSSIKNALESGLKWIQLRYKNCSKEEFIALGSSVKTLCSKHHATFIVNDYVEWSLEVEADGVHVGLEDMPIEAIKKILGPNKIIGGTANTFEHVLQRVQEGCDYIGLGPMRFTSTKENLSPILGFEGYEKIMFQLAEMGLNPKIYAIGGIQESDVKPLNSIGVYGVAASGMINTRTL